LLFTALALFIGVWSRLRARGHQVQRQWQQHVFFSSARINKPHLLVGVFLSWTDVQASGQRGRHGMNSAIVNTQQ